MSAIQMSRKGNCSVNGCVRPIWARGLCASHYKRMSRYGGQLLGQDRQTPWGEAQRFFDDVVMNYDGIECLTWPFAIASAGYGQLRRDGKLHVVSRLLCTEVHGPAPSEEHEAAHSCGNGHLACVAKSHITWKSALENAADRIAHGTQAHGESHGMAKLSEGQVRQIRSLKGLKSQQRIAEDFGVTKSAVQSILSGKRWAHVCDEVAA